MEKYITQMTNCNNSIWELLVNNEAMVKFAKYLPVSEIMLVLIITSLAFAFAVSFIKIYFFPRSGIFGILGASSVYLLSVKKMIDQIPMIHTRMNRALHTYVEVFQNYPEYTALYQKQTGDTKLEPGSVARYIYNLTGKERIKESDFLFSHIYETMDSIKGVVNQNTSLIVITLAVFLFIAVLIFCILKKRQHASEQSILLFIGSFLFLCCSLVNYGLLVTWAILWIVELAVLNLKNGEIPKSVG